MTTVTNDRRPRTTEAPSLPARPRTLRQVATIAWTSVVRVHRDRAHVASMAAIPLLIVAFLGAQYGGESEVSIGVTGDGEVAAGLVAELDDSDAASAVLVDSEEELRTSVAAGDHAFGVVLPQDADDTVAAGERLDVVTVTGPSDAAVLMPLVNRALTDRVAWSAAQVGLVDAGADPVAAEGALTAADEAERAGVELTWTGGGSTLGKYDYPALQQLVLLVFLAALLSASVMVQNRRIGVTRRMLAGPVSTGAVVAGEGLGRWAVAVVQAVYVIVATALIFRVDWWNIALTMLVVAAFAAVGAGAGMVLGSVLDDDGTVAGVALVGGLTLGAIGGAMLPADILPPAMATVASFMPHQWTIEAVNDLRAGAGVADIGASLGLLVGVAVALFAIAGRVLHRRLVRP
jgi:ABC-2 type transport system permease protein